MEHYRARIDTLRRSVRLLSPAARIERHRQTLGHLAATARNAVTSQVRSGKRGLAALARTLQAVSPLDTLSRGFVIATGPDGRTITRSAGLARGDDLLANFHDGAVHAEVRDRQPLPARLQPLEPTGDTEPAT